MSNLLVQVLHEHGWHVNHDDDANSLYAVVRKQVRFYRNLQNSFQFIYKKNVTMQNRITREFVRLLSARYASNTDVLEEYGDRTLPLYVLSLQARLGVRPWSDVELVFKNLPPQMASDAIVRRDGEDKLRSLHIAAGYAPRIVIDCML